MNNHKAELTFFKNQDKGRTYISIRFKDEETGDYHISKFEANCLDIEEFQYTDFIKESFEEYLNL